MTAQNSSKLTIVIVEGNFVERNILRKLLRLFLAQDLGSNFSVYTSDNGIQALGYVFITKPDLLILNSKLPEYAGIELAEFIDKNANKLENSTKLSVLITKSKEDELKLPENYLIFDKADKDFYSKIIQFIKINLLQIKNQEKKEKDKENKWVTKFGQKRVDQIQKFYLNAVLWLAKISLKSSEFEDRLIERAQLTKRPLLKIGRYFVWFLLQIFTTIFVSIFNLISGPGIKDENVAQEREDSYRFRIGYYPTMVTSIAAMLFLFIQLASFVIGGVALLNRSQNPSKAFASEVRWDGGGADNNWSTAANWSGDIVPGTGDTVIFDNTSTKDSSIDTVFSVKGIFIDATYTGTISQIASITLGSDGFTQNGGTYTSAGTIPQTNLAIWYKMNESAGSVITDYSSNHNDGGAVNSSIVTGFSGNGRNIAAGSSGYIGLGSTVDMSGDWSIALWSQFPLPTTGDGWRTFAAKFGGTYHHIIVQSDGQLGSYNSGFYTSGYNINSLSGWHHITVTGSNSNGSKYYVDGNLVGSNANKTGQVLGILGNYTSGGHQEWGTFDEVEVYTRELSLNEIQQVSINNSMDINGSFTLNSGSFTAPSQMYVSGNWTNNGTFNSNNGSLTLDGTNQSITGSNTFSSFTHISTGADTLTIQAGSTQTITGNLVLKGTSDYPLKLRSSSSPTQWHINPQGTRDIQYVDVKDSYNDNASLIGAIFLTDSGNNSGWVNNFSCLQGGNHNGNDWNPATDCANGEVAGTHTNIGAFIINSGQTVYVKANDGSTNYGFVNISSVSADITGSFVGTGRGYLGGYSAGSPNGSGAGGGVCYASRGTGGTNGGGGGPTGAGYSIPIVYTGSALTASTQGSGGGGGTYNNGYCSGGGNGGAAIGIVSSTTISLNGSINANGNDATDRWGGGGAGGSIKLEAATISGAGSITANGGSGGQYGDGAGGGGRILIKHSSAQTLSGTNTVNYGSSGAAGKNGTIVYINTSSNDLEVRNTQYWNANPSNEGANISYHNITVTNNATLYTLGYYTSNSDGIGMQFTVTNLTVDSGSTLSATGGGYAGGDATTKNGGGPGGGTGATVCSGGYFYGGAGSYGGTGGNSSGSTYGSSTAPLDLGSGAGLSYAGSCITGGNGGGAIKIIATNTLTVNGTLSANGETSGSGGSGGSLYLIAGTLEGSATAKIEAQGGNGANGNYGNGGGGRIALYFVTANNWGGQDLTPTASAHPGTGGVAGTNGTVFIGQTYIPGVSSLRQYRSDCSTAIATGGTTSQTSVCLGATINSNNNPDNLTVEFEIQPIGTAFTNTATATSDPIPFTGTPVTMTLLIPNSVVLGTNYHWQIQTIDQNGLSSGWTQYGGNLESETDFGGGNPNVQFQLSSESGSESTVTKTVVIILSDSSPSTITVDYSVTGGTATLNSDYTVTTPGTLTFPSNTTTQTFNISIVNDQIDEDNETIIFGLSNPSNTTIGTNSTYTYTINDNDTASVSAGFSGNNYAYEASAGSTGRIKLNSQPVDDVTVNISGDSQLNFSSTQLTFTSVNWNTYQYYDITIVDDSIAQGNRIVQITYAVSSLDTNYNNISVSASNFQILDDDTIGISLSNNTGWSLNEGGSGSFGVILTSQPTSDVVITLSSDNSRLAVSNSPITFTSANWNVQQNVLFNVVVDYKYQPTQTGNISSSVSSADGSYNNFSVSTVIVTVLNDDVVAVNQIPTSANFNEGSSVNYSISLRSQPASNVTITLDGGADVAFSQSSFTFTTANWNNIQTTSVSVAQDNAVTGTRNFAITHSASSSDTDYNGLTISNLTISVNDLDAPGITVTQSSGITTVTEGGSNDTYQIALISQPSSDVSIHLSRNNTNCQIDKTDLTFDGTNWDTPQTITVSAAARDYIDTGNLACVISHQASSSDLNYNSISISNVNVVINDVDTAGFTITEIGSNATFVAEAGTTDTVSVVLNSKPLFSVTINITDNSQLLTSPNYVLFTTENWNTTQVINISAVNDLIAQGDRTTQLELVPTSSDSKYSTLSNQYVNVSITDNDTAGFAVSNQSFNFTDKTQTQNFTVKLTSKPLDNVNISIQPSTNNLITLSTQNLVFTELNWNTVQTVTLGINSSVNSYSGNINLIFGISSTDLVYNALSISPSTVSINISDSSSEQSGSLVLSTSSLSFDTKETKSYTIKLSTQPTSQVDVTVTSNKSAITLNPDLVTFDDSNWNNAQTIQVTNNSNTPLNAVLTHIVTSSDTSYAGQTTSLPVTYTTAESTPTTTVTPTASPSDGSTPTPTNTKPTSTSNPTPTSAVIPTDSEGNPITKFVLTVTTIRDGELLPGISIGIIETNQTQVTNILGQAIFTELPQAKYTLVYDYNGKTYQREIDLNSDQKISIDLENIVDNTYVRPVESPKNFITDELGVVGIIGASLFTASILLLLFPYLQNLIFSAFILEFLKSLVTVYYKNYSEVLNKDSDKIVKFAQITISDSNGKVIARTVTNWQGRYRVKLQSGTYLININHTEYRTEYYEMPIEEDGYLQFKFEVEKSEENVIATTIQLRELKIEPKVLIYILGIVLVLINSILLMTFTSWLITGIGIVVGIYIFYGKQIIHSTILLRHTNRK